jgi:hypothetical protein
MQRPLPEPTPGPEIGEHVALGILGGPGHFERREVLAVTTAPARRAFIDPLDLQKRRMDLWVHQAHGHRIAGLACAQGFFRMKAAS